MIGAGGRPAWREALVAFGDAHDLWWLRILKPGFRHCFVALSDGGCWVVLDPLSHATAIAVHPPIPAGRLAAFYRGRGLAVVAVRPRIPPRRAAPWRPYTCVEAVKRVLGIQDGRIHTPWQLYRHLTGPAAASVQPE